MAEIVIRPAFWHNRARMKRIAQPMEQVMRRIKRAAVSVKPKQPYLEWANGLDEDGVKLGIEFTPEETIYLVDELAEGELDLETLLEPYFEIIFEEELNAWHRREADWPQERDFRLFQAWFDIELHSLVLDLKGGWLRTERYERY